MKGTHSGKGGDNEESYRKPPGFCNVGKDTGSASAYKSCSYSFSDGTMVTTHCDCSLTEPDSLSLPQPSADSGRREDTPDMSAFPGVLAQCLIQTHIHPCPHRDNQGVTSRSKPGRETDLQGQALVRALKAP